MTCRRALVLTAVAATVCLSSGAAAAVDRRGPRDDRAHAELLSRLGEPADLPDIPEIPEMPDILGGLEIVEPAPPLDAADIERELELAVAGGVGDFDRIERTAELVAKEAEAFEEAEAHKEIAHGEWQLTAGDLESRASAVLQQLKDVARAIKRNEAGGSHSAAQRSFLDDRAADVKSAIAAADALCGELRADVVAHRDRRDAAEAAVVAHADSLDAQMAEADELAVSHTADDATGEELIAPAESDVDHDEVRHHRHERVMAGLERDHHRHMERVEAAERGNRAGGRLVGDWRRGVETGVGGGHVRVDTMVSREAAHGSDGARAPEHGPVGGDEVPPVPGSRAALDQEERKAAEESARAQAGSDDLIDDY